MEVDTGAGEESIDLDNYRLFPPFYTLQSHTASRTKQLRLWESLVCRFCQTNKVHILEVSDSSKCELFRNDRIQRYLDSPFLRALGEFMVSNGSARWLDAARTSLLVLWKRPAEWGNEVYRWAVEWGKVGSVETVFSLHSGEETEGESFHGLPHKVIVLALEVLQEQGKAEIFRGESTEEDGVKFFN